MSIIAHNFKELHDKQHYDLAELAGLMLNISAIHTFCSLLDSEYTVAQVYHNLTAFCTGFISPTTTLDIHVTSDGVFIVNSNIVSCDIAGFDSIALDKLHTALYGGIIAAMPSLHQRYMPIFNKRERDLLKLMLRQLNHSSNKIQLLRILTLMHSLLRSTSFIDADRCANGGTLITVRLTNNEEDAIYLRFNSSGEYTRVMPSPDDEDGIVRDAVDVATFCDIVGLVL